MTTSLRVYHCHTHTHTHADTQSQVLQLGPGVIGAWSGSSPHCCHTTSVELVQTQNRLTWLTEMTWKRVCHSGPRKAAFSIWAHDRSVEQESLGVDDWACKYWSFFILVSYLKPNTCGLQLHVRKHFSSIKAVLLYKLLNQCTGPTLTRNTFRFIDIIKEYIEGNIERIFTFKSVF